MTEKDDDLVVICAPLTIPLYMPDNATACCFECNAPVQFRPYHRKGRKLCLACAVALHPDEKVVVTPMAAADLKTYFATKRH